MEEHINKLKQLDRIEYRIKRNFIISVGLASLNVAWYVLIMTAIITFTFIILISTEGKGDIYLLLPIVSVFMGVVASLSIGIIALLTAIKEKKELNKEYFKVEVKGSKK